MTQAPKEEPAVYWSAAEEREPRTQARYSAFLTRVAGYGATILAALLLLKGSLTALGAASWPVHLLVILIIGLAQYGLAITAHEAVHQYPDKLRRQLRPLRFLLFYSIGSTPEYRRLHFLHHRHLGEPAIDPDYPDYASAPRTRTDAALFMLSGLFGLKAVERFLAVYVPRSGTSSAAGDWSEAKEPPWVHLVSLAATQTALFATFCLFLSPWHYALVWLFPIASVTRTIGDLRLIAEHGYGSDGRAVLRGFTRSNWFSGLIAPLGFREHLEHHLYPGHDFRALAELRDQLKSQILAMPPPDRPVRYTLEYVDDSHLGFLIKRFLFPRRFADT